MDNSEQSPSEQKKKRRAKRAHRMDPGPKSDAQSQHRQPSNTKRSVKWNAVGVTKPYDSSPGLLRFQAYIETLDGF